jgi:hypothetical protein
MTRGTGDTSNMPFHLTSASFPSVARSGPGERQRSPALDIPGALAARLR